MEISEKEYRELVTRAVVAEEKNNFMTNEVKDIRNSLLKIQSTLDRFATFFGSFNKTPEIGIIPATGSTNNLVVDINKHDLTTGTIIGCTGPSAKLDTSTSKSIYSASEVSEIYAFNKMGQCGVSPSDLTGASVKNKKEK